MFVGGKPQLLVQCSWIYPDFLFAIQVSIYMLGDLLSKMKMAYLSLSWYPGIHHIINNRFLWWLIVRNMVVSFAILSVGKEAWLKSTIRWNALLFDWRFFSTKTCYCKDMDYWSLCGRCPPFYWATVSLTGGSVPALWGDTYCFSFVNSLQFTSSSLDTSFLVTYWVVIGSSLLSSSYDLDCTYSTFVQWAPAALPVSVSVFKSSLSTMAIGGFPYAMPRGQVLKVLAFRKAHMTYKRMRSL